ncbi:hypothetical protein ACLOJK_001464 [Asimina triloba]
MFTPQQRKELAGWSISARDAQRIGAGLGALSSRSVKGKAVAIEGGLPKSLLPPPAASSGENGGAAVDGGGGSELWQRFREAGLLDEAALEKRDREALVDRISKLEHEITAEYHELHEYQYTMGLLLIEKKEWASQFEDLSQTLAEAEEMLKREQAAHLIAISEVEKREENLRKALGVEKQCAADHEDMTQHTHTQEALWVQESTINRLIWLTLQTSLRTSRLDFLEKTLHEECTKSSDIVVSSDKKFAEAHALIVDIEDRKLEAERKLHAADAKMAEASRKNSEMERKLQELEARESFLHKEWSSIKAEHEEQEASLVKQREDLREWEMKLQEGQERLLEGQRLLNYREKRTNDREMFLDEREKHLDDKHKTVLMTSSTLEKLEDDINKRITALAVKEEEAAQKKQDLEMETQKLIVEHNAILNTKKREFELELDERRKSIEEELLCVQNAVKEKEEEINHKEEKVVKREQSVEKKMEKLKEKEREYESNLKSLKEREKLVKDEEKLTEAEKKEIETEKYDLIKLKAELEKDKAILIEKKQQILQEQDNLKVTEEERTQINSLQSKLKLEIDGCSHEKESLFKEREDLKQERDNFEREWEALDEKRVDNAKVLNEINKERERLERWKYEEEEFLKGKKLEMECYMQKELESLRLKKKAFEDAMEHDRSEILEKARKDHDDMLRSFDLRSHDLEISMQKRREDVEKLIQERHRAFAEETQGELMHINFLKEQAQKSKGDLKLEWQRLKRERQDMNESREHIVQDQLEIQNDINELNLLSGNLSHQREIFMKERARFLTFVEEHRSCRNCGATVLPNLQNLLEIKDLGPVCLPVLVKGNSKYCRKDEIGTSGGDVSWFQKCTSRIFNISPGKKTKDSIPEYYRSSLERLHEDEGVPGSSIGVMKSLERLHQDEGVPVSSIGLMNDSFGIDDSMRQMENENTVSFDEQSYAGQTQATSEAVSTSHENVHPQPPSSAQSSKRRPGKKSRLRSTRSVKQVVEEAKAFLGEASKEPPQSIEGGNGDSHRMDGRNTLVGQKRQHALAVGAIASSQDIDGNEDCSDSVTTIGRRKRRQTVAPAPQTPVERRAGTPSTRKAFRDQNEGKGREDHTSSTALPENEVLKGGENSGRTILKPVGTSPVACESNKDSCMLQEMMKKSIIMSERHAETEEFRVNTDVNETLICNIELSVQNDDQGQQDHQMALVAEVADASWGSEEEEEEEEETDNDGASIAKKVFRFFMT